MKRMVGYDRIADHKQSSQIIKEQIYQIEYK